MWDPQDNQLFHFLDYVDHILMTQHLDVRGIIFGNDYLIADNKYLFFRFNFKLINKLKGQRRNYMKKWWKIWCGQTQIFIGLRIEIINIH